MLVYCCSGAPGTLIDRLGRCLRFVHQRAIALGDDLEPGVHPTCAQVAGRALLQTLARLAHERHCLGEDERDHAAELCGLLLGAALDVDAVDRRDR